MPGFFGFANLGEIRYFGHVRDFLGEALHDLGIAAEVHAVKTPPTASLPRRAARLLEEVAARTAADDGPIHLVGHSTGGLDARLAVSPVARLPTALEVEPLAARVRTIVTLATPHRGTPAASFFAGALGRKLLRVLSLLTIHSLRLGGVPISVALELAAFLGRLDDLVLETPLLDSLFDQLLADFTPERRAELASFFAEVEEDTSLVRQLTPETADVFNASTAERAGVRIGSVVTCARRPGVGSALAAGLDPAAHATHALYVALHALTARTLPERVWQLDGPQAKALSAAYGALPDAEDNDGVVPTLSQPWGEVIRAVRADHLDVIGHFDDSHHDPPHYDWITTGTGFDRPGFEDTWRAVARFIAS
jgi:triacylglycerol lipase